MTPDLEIRIKDKNLTYSIFGIWIDDNSFRLTSNDPFNFKYTYGTVVELIKELNSENYILGKIIRESKYDTRRFKLNSSLKESDYRVIGDEIIKIGGYWELFLNSYAIVNIPNDSNFNLDEVLELFPEQLEEIIPNDKNEG